MAGRAARRSGQPRRALRHAAAAPGTIVEVGGDPVERLVEEGRAPPSMAATAAVGRSPHARRGSQARHGKSPSSRPCRSRERQDTGSPSRHGDGILRPPCPREDAQRSRCSAGLRRAVLTRSRRGRRRRRDARRSARRQGARTRRRRRRNLRRARCRLRSPLGWNDALGGVVERAAAWRVEYNMKRPHSSLGWLAPAAYAERWEAQQHAGLS